jgi:hypothetical protein
LTDDPGVWDPVAETTETGDSDGDAETLLNRAVDMVSSARAMPLSASVLVARDELLAVLHQALERLPEDMRQARWLLRERDEFLAQRQREADELLEDVRAQAERMVQRTEIVRQANQVAQRILEDARAESRRLRHEADDYCDQRLATFQIVLDRTMKTVQAGREKLQATPAPLAHDPNAGSGARTERSASPIGAGAPSDADGPVREEAFFDQDET